MGIKFNSDMINENLKKLYPEPFPEIWEKWQAPTDEFLQNIKGEIKDVYNEDGVNGLHALIEDNEGKIKRLKRRLDKDFPHDDSFKIRCALEYFEIMNQQARKTISEHDELSTDGRLRYTEEMKKEAKKYYNDHKNKADEMASNSKAKTWVENELIPHLANEFNKDEDYFNESTLRRDWLKLTA